MKTYLRALAAATLLTAASARTTPAQVPAQTQPAPAQQQTTQTQQQTTQSQQQTTQPAPQTTPTPQADAAKPPSAAGKAVVFVYRPGKLVGGALEPSVYCDGVEVARMDNGRYFVLLLDPGEHRIRTTQEYKRVDLKLGADEADAAKELKKLKPLGADKVKDSTRVADAAEAENQLRLHVK